MWQGVMSLPSALTSLVVCADVMCAWAACSLETTEQDAPESSNIRISRLLSMPCVHATLLVLCVSVGTVCTCVFVHGVCVTV